jgi:hypothetical protein
MVGKHKQWMVAAVVIGLGAGMVTPAVAVFDDFSPIDEVASTPSEGLLDGLLTGEGGLLGPRGVLGSEGGLLPSLLGGHSTPEEFAEGTEELVDGMGYLTGEMVGLITSPGTDTVGGDRVGEGTSIGGGLLAGVLGGLLGRS